MIRLLYVSNTSRDLDAETVNDILKTSRANNSRLGVTGMLLHLDGSFMQVLEGERATVEGLYNKIEKDKRHWDPRVLLTRPEPPAFLQWSMGFKNLHQSCETDAAFKITREAIQGRFTPSIGPELLTMLKTFYKVQTSEELI